MNKQHGAFANRSLEQQRAIEDELGVPDWLRGFDVTDPLFIADPRKPRRLIAWLANVGGPNVVAFPHRRVRNSDVVAFDMAWRCYRRFRRPGMKPATVVPLPTATRQAAA